MITLLEREVPTGDFLDMTREELENEWRKATECFDQVRVQKTETDRIYVAAATRLNTLDRLMKKVQNRAVVERRAAAKYLYRSA